MNNLELFTEGKGTVKYTFDVISNRDYEGIAIDANGRELVRIERDAMTGERHVYVWNETDEDYIKKVKFNPFYEEES